MKPKFIIVSFRQTAGGPIVLHKLCRMLQDRGYDARVFIMHWTKDEVYKHKIKFWFEQVLYLYVYDTLKLIRAFFKKKSNTNRKLECFIHPPVKGCKRKILPFFNKRKTIVVYSEVVWGNFLNAKNVIRWLLNKNHYGDEARDKNDLIIAFRDFFNDWTINPDGKKVTLNNFNSDLYKRTNFGERKGKCYIIRKGKSRKDLPESFDGPIVDNLTDEQMVKVFNECESCECYDMQTFYASIAALCGCKVVLMPEPGKTKADYRTENEKSNGIAFGSSEDELKRAEETLPLLEKSIAEIEVRNNAEIERFINYCKEHFTQFDFK